MGIAVAVLGTCAALALRALADPWLHERIPYITVYPVVIAVSLWAGWIPGLVALALGSVLSAYLFVDWDNDLPASALSTTLFVAVGIALVVLGNYQRCAAADLMTAAQDARRATEAMRESELRYRAMIELCPDAVVVYKDERVVFSNPAANRIFGVHSLVGLNPFDLAHPRWRTLMRERMRRMLETDEPAPLLEAEFLHQSNGIIEAELTSVAVPWAGGKAIQVMGRDCTARKRAERALRESEARFRALAEDVPDVIYTCAPDGHCDFVNRRFTELTGLSFEETVGYGWLHALHPDDIERATKEWQMARERGQPYEFKYRFRDSRGQHHWFMGRARPIRDEQGHILQWFGTITDIDAMVRFEEHLQRRASELAESNTDLEEFAQVVAHDLKEPLRGIATCAASISEDYRGSLDEEGLDRLETLVRLPRRMYQQLDGLLEYSRVGKTRLAIRDTDLHDLVNHVKEDLAHWLREQNGEVRIIEPLPSVRCDPIRIEQVLRNLIVNGIKYNQSEAKLVEVGAEQADTPTFFVRDNGIGIAERHHEIVFTMFRRLHTREAYGGGAGAGLAIVKRIIERHGGRIWVDSSPGRGTTFHFTLSPDPVPNHRPAQGAGNAQQPTPAPPKVSVTQGLLDPPVVETPARIIERPTGT